MVLHNVCRAQDYYLWFSSAKPGLTVLAFVLAILLVGIFYIFFSKNIRENMEKMFKSRGKGNSSTMSGISPQYS